MAGNPTQGTGKAHPALTGLAAGRGPPTPHTAHRPPAGATYKTVRIWPDGAAFPRKPWPRSPGPQPPFKKGRECDQELTSGKAAFLEVTALPIVTLSVDAPPPRGPGPERYGSENFQSCPRPRGAKAGFHPPKWHLSGLNPSSPLHAPISPSLPSLLPALVNLCVLHSPTQNLLVWRANVVPPLHRHHKKQREQTNAAPPRRPEEISPHPSPQPSFWALPITAKNSASQIITHPWPLLRTQLQVRSDTTHPNRARTKPS